MTYPLKARVHRRNFNLEIDGFLDKKEVILLQTNYLKIAIFYKPDLFSNIKSLENKDIINSVDTFAYDWMNT